jgi:hypothetical protein
MAPTSLLDLPMEIRLAIYSEISSSLPVAASPYLYPYHGLLLSCHQIYAEFEAEALKDVEIFFKRLESTRAVELDMPVFEKLAHTIRPQISLRHGVSGVMLPMRVRWPREEFESGDTFKKVAHYLRMYAYKAQFLASRHAMRHCNGA